MLRRDMMPSKYLKQSDFDTAGTILTISHVTDRINVAKAEDPPDYKFVLFFHEMGDSGLILNNTTTSTCFDVCGDDSNDWSGKEIIVYVDPNITFGDKKVGGLRLRAHTEYQAPKPPQPRQAGGLVRQSAPAPSTAPTRLAPPHLDSDVPF